MEDEDENFLDDEWDVPDEQLHILEQRAVGSTQQENIQQDQLRNLINEPKTASVLGRSYHASFPSSTHHGNKEEKAYDLQGPTDLENYDIDAMVDDAESIEHRSLEKLVPHQAVDETTLREQWRLNRFGASRRNLQQTNNPRRQGPPSASFEGGTAINKAQDEEKMRSMLQELRHERDLLSQNLHNASRDLRTAKGEIAVIRENTSNDNKSFERQVSLLRKQMQEEAAKHQASIQAKDDQHRQLVTNHRFLKHELDEQMQKISSLQFQLKQKPPAGKSADLHLTPRKGGLNSINDGFDDDMVSFTSPTKSPAKSARKSKQSTPTNRKRKQQATELDIQPLALRTSGNVEVQPDKEASATLTEVPRAANAVRKDHENARHLYLIQKIIHFQPSGSGKPLFERLVAYCFPTETPRTLSSQLLIRIADLKGNRLPAELLEVFIHCWTQALKETYHEPIPLLIEAINHVLDVDPTLLDKEVLNKLLPTLTDTAVINATIRFHLAGKSKSRVEGTKQSLKFDPHTDSLACLDLLYTVACLVCDDLELLIHFWRLIRTDHVLLALSSSQPIPEISLMLQLLSTSILPETFGNVCGSPEEQLKMQTFITDRICFLLWENMKQVDETQGPYSRAEVCKLRLEALHLLSQFANTSSRHPHSNGVSSHHGTTFLVNHPTAIARLVRSIYDEVDNMYNLYPTHSLHAELVNQAVSILHHLITSSQVENTTLTTKLAGTLVGVHKFRVMLTRLAFRDGTVLDKGISDETVSKATQILEGYVTPDEAAALLEAFGKSPDTD